MVLLRAPAALALGLLGCSLTYGDPPVGQCTSDADCENGDGLEGSRCDVQHGVCVLDATRALQAGTEPIICPTRAGGSSGEAATSSPLLTPECPCLEGDWADPAALIVGTIAPHSFGTVLGQAVEIPHVPRWLRAIELGLAEWRAEIPGGRLPRANRPLALLHCNSGDELPQTRRVMTHLLQVARAPVVLTLSDNDTTFARYQALRQGATLICSTCLSAAPEAPSETELIWQIAPPLVRQAPLAVHRVGQLLEQLRGERALDIAAPFEVVSLSQQYPGINDFVAEVEQGLTAAGVYHITPVQTPDPHAQNPVQLAVASAVVAAEPQVIVVGMDTDFTTYYLRMIESEWPPAKPRPHYVLTYLNQELGLLADIVQNDDELRRRITGTGFGLGERAAQNLSGLEQRFRGAYSEGLDNTQYGYDAFYAAVYALMMTDRLRPLDGAELSASLGRLGTGPAANVGPAALRGSLASLLAGQTLDLVGTSGELDWHPTRHQPEGDVVLWCLTRDAGGGLGLLADAGLRWHADSAEISGSYVCP